MYDKRFPPGKVMNVITPTDWPNKSPLLNQATIYPRSISFMDIDEAMFKWLKGRDLLIGNEVVPVFFLSPEKWSEFKTQWQYMDGEHKVDFPYITVRRVGFTPAQTPVKGRIPGKNFTIYRMPVQTPAGPSMMHYKVPQPIKVDMTYEVRIMTLYISDINVINETLLRHFASLQAYLDIDKHYMPMLIESVSDESETDNVENERILHNVYNIQVRGYIIDEDEFEEKLGVSDIIVNIDEDTN